MTYDDIEKNIESGEYNPHENPDWKSNSGQRRWLTNRSFSNDCKEMGQSLNLPEKVIEKAYEMAHDHGGSFQDQLFNLDELFELVLLGRESP